MYMSVFDTDARKDMLDTNIVASSPSAVRNDIRNVLWQARHDTTHTEVYLALPNL